MAWGTKYRIIFNNYFGEECYVNIQYDGYSGSITNLIGKGIPVTYSMPSSDRKKTEWIKGQSLRVDFYNLTFNQYTDDFLSYGNKDVLCQYVRAGSTIFYGFMIPDELDETYLPGPNPISVMFTDGLGLLKEEPYKNGDIIYYGRKTLMQILFDCLNKTGLLQIMGTIWESCIFYEQNHSQGDTDSPLTQTYVSSEHFIADDEDISCYEVLQRILISQAARIEQRNGTWRITPLENFKSSFIARQYTAGSSGFTYYSYGTLDDSFTLSNATASPANLNCFLNHSQVRKVHKAFKEFTVKFEYQKKESIIFTKDFKYFDNDGILFGWTEGTAFSGMEINNADTNYKTMLNWPGKVGINYNDKINNNFGFYELSQSFKGLKIKLELKIKIKGNIASSKFRYRVYSNSILTGNRYSLKNDGTWNYAATIFINTYEYTNNDIGNYMEDISITITSDKITSDLFTTIYIDLYNPETPIRFNEVYFESCTITIEDIYDRIADDITKTIAINNKNIETEEIILKLGDVPNINHDRVVYFNIFSLNTLTRTSSWTKKDESDYKQLVELVAESLASLHNRNMWQLSGEILGHLSSASRVIDNTMGKIFLINEFDEDVKHSRFFINLLEIDQEAYLLHEDGDIIETETGEYIEIE